jgi:hypothetical protein
MLVIPGIAVLIRRVAVAPSGYGAICVVRMVSTRPMTIIIRSMFRIMTCRLGTTHSNDNAICTVFMVAGAAILIGVPMTQIHVSYGTIIVMSVSVAPSGIATGMGSVTIACH